MREESFPPTFRRVLYIVGLMFLSTISQAAIKVLHSFVPSPAGFGSTANLIQDPAGHLYGTTQTDGLYGLGTVFKLERRAGGKWRESIIHSFAGGEDDGSTPVGGLVLDAAGNLYGTTALGGTGVCEYGNSCGTVFKLSPRDGGLWTESVLYNFQPPPDGSSPIGNLVIDSKGDLFGVTEYGGTGEGGNGGGVVYELTPNSQGQWTETIIHTFQGGSDGALPLAGLIFDQRGNLYGTTSGESNIGAGTVFELIPRQNGTWTHSVLYAFDAYSSTQTSLIFDAAGNLYGTGLGGPGVGCGGYGCGFVFELIPGPNGGWTYNTLYVFEGGPDGASPMAGLVFDPAGNLYGTTFTGGTPPTDCNLGRFYSGCGTVFELSPRSKGKWKERVIFRFAAGILANGSDSSGVFPVASLLIDGAGNLYGTTEVGGSPRYWAGTVFKLSPENGSTWASSVLYNFGLHKDGANPEGSVVADSTGNLYGTNTIGGTGACRNNGCGTVYKVAPLGNRWKESVIYNFTGGADGFSSQSSLVLDSAGSLYGTATYGGLLCPINNDNSGCGTIFKLEQSEKGAWTETTLHQFVGGGSDGIEPIGGLTLDSKGNLYGTTSQGGSCSAEQYGCGTVFELTPSGTGWSEKLLYSFAGGTDGMFPIIPLVFDNAGNLYGATDSTVFQLTPNSGGGWMETIIYPVVGVSGLIFDNMGNLYGTASSGGNQKCYCGMVFELTRATNGVWTETVLHQFSGYDGAYPAGIAFDSAGVLYGTTTNGGENREGLIFSLTPGTGGKWTEAVLNRFDGTNGMFPNGPPILDSSGRLFGTTSAGGLDDRGNSDGSGVVFEYSPSYPELGDTPQVSDHSTDGKSLKHDQDSLAEPPSKRTTERWGKVSAK
jgi:uncharacterized repeat protein (TIGR03803 family)